MNEKFFLIRIVDKVERRRESFSRADLKQVTDGLRYAGVRDSLPKRRQYYVALNELFWKVLR